MKALRLSLAKLSESRILHETIGPRGSFNCYYFSITNFLNFENIGNIDFNYYSADKCGMYSVISTIRIDIHYIRAIARRNSTRILTDLYCRLY